MTDAVAALVQVIGVGNELRGDDRAALEAVRLIRAASEARPPGLLATRARCGDLLGLIDVWDQTPAVILVDAMRSGRPPGAIHRFDAGRHALPVGLGGAATTHAAGLEEVIALARVLRRLPPRLIVYGIEGGCFDHGADLSEPVRAALPTLVRKVVVEARRLVQTPVGGADLRRGSSGRSAPGPAACCAPGASHSC